MRIDLLQLASELAASAEPFALATVVRREAPSSAQVGDTAIVTHDGTFHGWVGGSCAQPTVVREALAALDDHKSRLIALSPAPELDRRPGVTPIALTCHSGGSLDIFIEPVLPAPRLVVFGVSPIARALVRIGKATGYAVDAIDPDASAATFPEADGVYNSEVQVRGVRVTRMAAWVSAVVATMGQWDEEATRDAITLEPDYLGVVASRKRFSEIRELLEHDSIAKEKLSRIKNPAGLDINAQSADEIALSILAEIVRTKNATQSAAQPKPLPVFSAPAPTPAPAVQTPDVALDPVCGMSVKIATARHVAELDGRTWYFCAAGCRERFLREPQRYGVTVNAG